jgi:hypothetical protein
MFYCNILLAGAKKQETKKIVTLQLQTLAARGLEELFFQLWFCVSFWFWREIGFGFTSQGFGQNILVPTAIKPKYFAKNPNTNDRY